MVKRTSERRDPPGERWRTTDALRQKSEPNDEMLHKSYGRCPHVMERINLSRSPTHVLKTNRIEKGCSSKVFHISCVQCPKTPRTLKHISISVWILNTIQDKYAHYDTTPLALTGKGARVLECQKRSSSEK